MTRIDEMVREYEAWLRQQPDHIARAHDTSAEALLHENITDNQRRFLSDFIERWYAAARADEAKDGARDAMAAAEHDDSECADRQRGYGQPDSLSPDPESGEYPWM